MNNDLLSIIDLSQKLGPALIKHLISADVKEITATTHEATTINSYRDFPRSQVIYGFFLAIAVFKT